MDQIIVQSFCLPTSKMSVEKRKSDTLFPWKDIHTSSHLKKNYHVFHWGSSPCFFLRSFECFSCTAIGLVSVKVLMILLEYDSI